MLYKNKLFHLQGKEGQGKETETDGKKNSKGVSKKDVKLDLNVVVDGKKQKNVIKRTETKTSASVAASASACEPPTTICVDVNIDVQLGPK